MGEVGYWAVHPGGPKILTAVRDAMAIGENDLRFSRGVLEAHGNMSSTTGLFILQQMAKAGAEGSCVALGFGPGLMMEDAVGAAANRQDMKIWNKKVLKWVGADI